MKHIPLRKCTGCGEMKPKKDLLRIVKTLDENEKIKICIDFTGKINGRGAYICKNSSCFKLAKKARRLERTFSCKIPAELYDNVEEELLKNEC